MMSRFARCLWLLFQRPLLFLWAFAANGCASVGKDPPSAASYQPMDDAHLQRQLLFNAHLQIALGNRRAYLYRPHRPRFPAAELSTKSNCADVIPLYYTLEYYLARIQLLLGEPHSAPTPLFGNHSADAPQQVDPACADSCELSAYSDNSLESILPLPENPAAPHVVLSSGWIHWPYTQLMHRQQINLDPDQFPARQLLGTISHGDTMLRHPISEDLSKLSALVHWSRYADVRVLGWSQADVDRVVARVELVPEWPGRSEVHRPVLELLPGFQHVRQCHASEEDPSLRWWYESGYLKRLSELTQLHSLDVSCQAEYDTAQLPLREPPRFLLSLDPWLVEDHVTVQYLPTLWEARRRGLLVVHLGVDVGLPGVELPRQRRTFPRRSTLSQVEDNAGSERPFGEVWLPQWHVIPFDAFATVEDLAAYLLHLTSDPTDWEWHWQISGQVETQLSRWSQMARKWSWDAAGEDAWTCRVCRMVGDRSYEVSE